MNRPVLTLIALSSLSATEARAEVFAEVHFSSLSNMCTVTDSEWHGDPELVMRYGAYSTIGAGRGLRFCDQSHCLFYAYQDDWASQKLYSIGDDVESYQCGLDSGADRCDGNTYQSIDESFVVPVPDRADEIYFSMQLVDRDWLDSDNLGSHLEYVQLAPAGSYTGIHPVSRWNNNNQQVNATHHCSPTRPIDYDGASGNYRIHATTRVWDDTAPWGWTGANLLEDGETLTLDIHAWDGNSGLAKVGYVLGHWDEDLETFVVDVEAEFPHLDMAYVERVKFCSEDAAATRTDCDHVFEPVAGRAYAGGAWAENGGEIEITNVRRTVLGWTWYNSIDWGLEIPPQVDPSEMPHWLDGLAIGDSVDVEPVLIPLEQDMPYDLELDAGDAQAEPGDTQEVVIKVTNELGALTAVENPVEIALSGRATVVSTDLIDATGLGTGMVQGILPPEGMARFEVTYARTADIDVSVRVKGTFDESTRVTFGPTPIRGEDPQSIDDRDSEGSGDLSTGL